MLFTKFVCSSIYHQASEGKLQKEDKFVNSMLDAVRMENSKSISKTEYNRRIVILDSIPKTLTTLAPTTHCSFNDFLLLRFQIFNCIPIFACLVISPLQILPTSFSLSLVFRSRSICQLILLTFFLSSRAFFQLFLLFPSLFLHILSSSCYVARTEQLLFIQDQTRFGRVSVFERMTVFTSVEERKTTEPSRWGKWDGIIGCGKKVAVGPCSSVLEREKRELRVGCWRWLTRNV